MWATARSANDYYSVHPSVPMPHVHRGVALADAHTSAHTAETGHRSNGARGMTGDRSGSGGGKAFWETVAPSVHGRDAARTHA
eukprot:1485480-Prymnesium_polylepis.1